MATISLVCESRSTRKVGSSWAILASEPESLASSPRLLGRDGQPDHRRGEHDRRHGQLAQGHAGAQVLDLGHGDDLAGPGLVDRLGLVGLDLEELRDLQALAHADDRHGVARLAACPRRSRRKLSFCTKGSMRVLKTWATSGPAGSALTSTSSPAAFWAVRGDDVGRQAAQGHARPSAPASPTPVFAETHTMGISEPWATAADQQPRDLLRRWAAGPRSTAT